MIGYLLLCINLLQVIVLGKGIILENRSPGNTMTWIFILALFPVLGFILYLLFGKPAQGLMFPDKHSRDNPLKDWVSRQQACLKDQEFISCPERKVDSKLLKLHLNSGFAPLTINNQAEILLNGGEKFQALFKALEEASQHIHLSYFIFNEDEIGEDVLKILSRKVKEGVEVRVILDGLGSLSLSGKLMKRMEAAGIQARWFFPLRFPYLTSKLNLRYHRKIVVIDGSIGFIGGLNIGDEYLSRDSKLGFWRDTHLKLQGEAVQVIQAVFLNDWYFVTGEEMMAARYFPKNKVDQVLPVQILASGPDSKWNSILCSFFSSMTMAKQRICIATPYFIPEESLVMALKTAVFSGLEVQLMVQGIPEHKLTYLAMNSYFEELLEAGVKIFQYMKGTLHAKILLVDDHLALVGSANMDRRSFFLDFEISAFIYDDAITAELNNNFAVDLKDCREVILEEFQGRSLLKKYKESCARLLSPLL